jgi:RND family efflux transporter MFP subunit
MSVLDENIKSADSPSASRQKPARAGSRARRIILPLVLVGIAYAAYHWGLTYFRPAEPTEEYFVHIVKPGNLLVTVTEDGNLESSDNYDIKCEVPGGSTILSIVPNGTNVKTGEELVRLDSSSIEDQVNAQTINYEKAVSAKIEAETGYDAAKIALQEYEEGTFPKDVQTADANITIAEENQRSAENMNEHTERMARKGYVTGLQRDAQEFAVKRAQIDLAVARLAKSVLEKFTKAKMVGSLKSAADTAEAKMRSAQAQFDLEKSRLDRLRANLEKCTIHAPHDGLVEYANDAGMGGRRGGDSGVAVEEGAAVRERQSILRMPDLTKMQVKVLIHESRISDVHAHLPAVIHAQDAEMHGDVTYVANQAEAPNWFTPSVRKYVTLVRIDDPDGDLRTGMTASVEILVTKRNDVLTIPVQCIAEVAGDYHVWLKGPNGPEDRIVKLGPKSLTDVEITSGLAAGDAVLLDPRPLADKAKRDAPHESDDYKNRFSGVSVAEASADANNHRDKPGGPRSGGKANRGAGGSAAVHP